MGARKLLGYFITLTCLFVAGALWWSKSGKTFFRNELLSFAPEVEIKALYISHINDRNVTIVGDAIIKNNFPSRLVIDSLDYNLYIDSVPVLHSAQVKQISIARNGAEKVAIPMHLDVKKIRQLIRKFEREKRDSASYTVKGEYKMKVPVAGMRKFKINESKIAPAIRDIHVKAGKMNFEKMGLKKTEMSVSVNVDNHNAFPIQMKNGHYNLAIDHGIEMQGEMQRDVDIPAKGSATIEMNINTKTAKLPKLGWKWIFREHRTHYKMKFSCIVMSDTEIMHNAALNVSDEGTLDELKQLTKKLKD